MISEDVTPCVSFSASQRLCGIFVDSKSLRGIGMTVSENVKIKDLTQK
ncbi:MAG: hypothetical protein Q7T53_06045 [Deltaproteobacteria bacterium]|nr:hypothetical protein [Deltaproteobacteria bacterium]